jgi:hypothetical protein
MFITTISRSRITDLCKVADLEDNFSLVAMTEAWADRRSQVKAALASWEA